MKFRWSFFVFVFFLGQHGHPALFGSFAPLFHSQKCKATCPLTHTTRYPHLSLLSICGRAPPNHPVPDAVKRTRRSEQNRPREADGRYRSGPHRAAAVSVASSPWTAVLELVAYSSSPRGHDPDPTWAGAAGRHAAETVSNPTTPTRQLQLPAPPSIEISPPVRSRSHRSRLLLPFPSLPFPHR
jgi:hypothetical protein